MTRVTAQISTIISYPGGLGKRGPAHHRREPHAVLGVYGADVEGLSLAQTLSLRLLVAAVRVALPV